MMTIDSINAFYGDVHILHNVSMEIREHEIVTLLGSNGAGKTTTIKCIFGLLPIKSGSITFNDIRLDKKKPYELATMGVSLIPEGRKLFPAMSVHDNLLMGAYSMRDKKKISENIEWVYGMFPRLKERYKQLAGTMSGGEQQMCAIARGLVIRPRFVVLDEPSLGLAPLIVDQIFDTIKELTQKHDTTVLLIEQNASLALEVSDRGYVLENGHVTLSGDTRDLLASDEVQKAYLGL